MVIPFMSTYNNFYHLWFLQRLTKSIRIHRQHYKKRAELKRKTAIFTSRKEKFCESDYGQKLLILKPSFLCIRL